MKTQCQSARLALWLDAEETTQWWLLGFQVKDYSQDHCDAQQILQINDTTDCTGSLDIKLPCNAVQCLVHAMAVSAEAWHAICCLITPGQYLLKDQPLKTRATKTQVERTIQDC